MPPTLTKLVVGYFPGWAIHARNYHVSDIPADKLTHINYAFAGISDNGEECISINLLDDQINFPALQLLKKQRPNLRTLISVGGASNSNNFSITTKKTATRKLFAQSCVSFMKVSGFDGIDIDWEFPSPNDKKNYTALLTELRSQLDTQGTVDGKHYLLTAALPAEPDQYVNLELDKVHQNLDWVNLMAYNFYTALSDRTNFVAPLYPSSSDPEVDLKKRTSYNLDASVKAYLSAGVPPSKLVVGVPFSGQGWEGVKNINHGLYQPTSSPAQGTWAKDGIIDFEDLKNNYAGTYLRFWSAEASAPWLYNPDTGMMISYEDAQSLCLKADYVNANKLAGMMIWQLSADDSQSSMVNALVSVLKPSPEPVKSQNITPLLASSARRISKATYVPLKVEEQPNGEGRAIVKFSFLGHLSLQPGEVEAAREKISVESISGREPVNDSVWNTLRSFEGSPIPSQLPSPSVFTSIPASFFKEFGDVIVSLRQQAIETAPEVGSATMIAKKNLHNAAVVATNGFEANVMVTPIGMLNLERLEMTPAGIQRGELIATIPLAPLEQTAVVHKEWSVTSKEFTSIVTDSLENYSETGVTENTELAQSTTSQNTHSNQFNINATVSGGYGPVTATVASAFSAQDQTSNSATESRKHAISTTRKASARVKQEHKVTISTTTVTGTSETSTRMLQNPSNTDTMRIDYFSIMRKWHVGLYRYGLRMTYDIAIPEPGATIRRLYAQLDILQKQTKPFDFMVKQSEIIVDKLIAPGVVTKNYQDLADQYKVQVPPPPVNPGRPQTPNGSVPGLDDTENWHFFPLQFTIPDGYWIKNVTVDAHLGLGNGYKENMFGVEHVFFKKDNRQDLHLDHSDPSSFDETNNPRFSKFLNHFMGNITVTFFLQRSNVAWVGMTIETEPTPESMQQWQSNVWNALYNAAQTQYYANQQDIQAQIAALEDKINNVDTLTLRREESEEIMKGVLRWILGPTFDFMPDDVSKLYASSTVDLEHGAVAVTDTGDGLAVTAKGWLPMLMYEEMVKFINEAIEWENVLYFFYSYFWDVPQSWNFIRQIKHPDATRQAFLRAGSARVVLTVRKGWEEAWVTFVETGGFGDTLIPNHPYMSIAKEIQNYDEKNYPGIPPANPGGGPLPDSGESVATVSSDSLNPGKSVTFEVKSSKGFMVGYTAIIDSYDSKDPNDPNATIQEKQTITAVPDADDTHITVERIDNPHDGSMKPFVVMQAGEKGQLIAEWFEYTPTSGTDIAVTSNLATIAG